MTQRCSIVLQLLMYILKNKAASIETACIIARGIVVELLSQGQMTGLCTWTYSPFLTTF